MNLDRRHWAALIAGAAVIIFGLSTTTSSANSSSVADPTVAFEQQKAAGCKAELDSATTSAQRTRAQNCINDANRAIKWLTQPSPSPTDSPTPSPTTTSPSPSPTTASPSPTPTSASPSPSPTTQSPSPSPTTASPSPSPSPSGPMVNCMPVPSACGYPDSTNTGIPPGTTLTTFNGDAHFNAPGIYTNMNITGCVYIEASNVTLRKVKITGDCWFAIRTAGISGATWTNLVVEDSEIVLSAVKEGSYGICCSNYTLSRVWIHGSPLGNAGADCVYFANNVLVQDSFCEVGILPGNPPGNPNATSAHSDGMTSDGGNGVMLLHNTIRNPNQQTSGILLSTNSSSVTNTTIRNGLYAGGGYTVYCGTDGGGIDAGTVFEGNRIARDWNGSAPGYYANGGFFGPITHCTAALGSGNIWDNNNAPLLPNPS